MVEGRQRESQLKILNPNNFQAFGSRTITRSELGKPTEKVSIQNLLIEIFSADGLLYLLANNMLTFNEATQQIGFNFAVHGPTRQSTIQNQYANRDQDLWIMHSKMPSDYPGYNTGIRYGDKQLNLYSTADGELQAYVFDRSKETAAFKQAMIPFTEHVTDVQIASLPGFAARIDSHTNRQ